MLIHSLLPQLLTPALLLCLVLQSPSVSSEPEEELPVSVVAVDPSGQRIAAGDSRGLIVLLCPEDGDVLTNLEPSLGEAVLLLEFSSDGTQLAALSMAGQLVIWNFARLDSSGAPQVSSSPKSAGTPGGRYGLGDKLLWSPNGKTLVLGYESGITSLWSSNAELLKKWTVPHPDGELAPESLTSEFGPWRTLEPGVEGGGDPQLTFSPDGATLYTANMDRLQLRDGLRARAEITSRSESGGGRRGERVVPLWEDFVAV